MIISMFHQQSVLYCRFRMLLVFSWIKREKKTYSIHFITLSAFQRYLGSVTPTIIFFVLFNFHFVAMHVKDYRLRIAAREVSAVRFVYFFKLQTLQRNKSTFTHHSSSCYWTERITEETRQSQMHGTPSKSLEKMV